ncbi:diaminopimelate epimerase [Croceibacterium sp. TMG7-5b_MA50]|uniref:diaminopimelate epimerase n=1 Tax=Croceibacterium sp. TMG7-5b_MA50 TaxID=3121290 RepID=UPI00322203B5
MRASFTKMHGLGNDFVVLDARDGLLPPLHAGTIRALADRHTGIGCDQLLLLEPSSIADLKVRIFNADGSEVAACGNAMRAVALRAAGDSGTQVLAMETAAGVIRAEADGAGFRVDMGEPRLDWDAIPLAYPMDTLALPVGWEGLERPVCVNVGNPHAVFFVPDCDAVPLARLGPQIERDPLFPERVNVNVASVIDRTRIRLRVWERGAGLTRACGTGACATAIAAMRRGLTEREVEVALPGGPLRISWGADGRISMAGPAAESFSGSFDWGDYL